MEQLITIRHEDFTLIVDCAKYDEVVNRAANNVGKENLTSTYTFQDAESLEICGENVENGGKSQAVFFDNTEYSVWVEFVGGTQKAQFNSLIESDNQRFTFRHNILAGFVNYQNEIGKSEFSILYEKSGQKKSFVFGFEVLSQKLDYHQHWKTIVEDIEREYRLLSLDYLKRTFHSFSPDSQGDTPELIWWSIFHGEQQKFLAACKSIIENPRRKTVRESYFVRAEKLKFVPRTLENQLAENRLNPSKLYKTETFSHTNNTVENRFLKFALQEISKHYNNLKIKILNLKNLSDTARAEMERTSATMQKLLKNPFFRTVGVFKGFSQESLIMQRAFGYSQVYKTFNLLRRAYSLSEGLFRLQTKDIATLYEIWCFIQVAHIIRERLNIGISDIENHSRIELNNLFSWDLDKGKHSKILFKKDGISLVELYYNPKETEKLSLDHLTSPTVPQKPDIVLQLIKNDIANGMKFTYLFDAKYRIAGRDSQNVDFPPDDAINQMHRYRDAIYYQEPLQNALKKEVIGGYILFPGSGEKASVEVSKFYESITNVNIGAFPLRPCDNENKVLLKEFISGLISSDSPKLIGKVIPQKGTVLEIHDRVLIGLAKRDIDKYHNSTAELYYSGSHFPTTIPLDGLHYFVPYIKEKGIRDLYEITKIRTITSQEAKNSPDGAGDDLRLAFHLRFLRRLYDDYKKIDTGKLVNYTFVDTRLGDLKTIVV